MTAWLSYGTMSAIFRSMQRLCEKKPSLIEQAHKEKLWVDKYGETREIAQLEDSHIVSIVRSEKMFPADYEPLIKLVKKEKALRDSKRKNKFFSESQVL